MMNSSLRTSSLFRTSSVIQWEDARRPRRSGEFFKDLSAAAIDEFESLAAHFCCPPGTVLIKEDQDPLSVMFVFDGEVNLRMESYLGKRFILGIAGPGEILGLAAAISGINSRVGAEARCLCSIALLKRQDFLDFLLRHPIACQNVARELSQQHIRTCERLRIVGLTSSTQARLAQLLLEWCADGRQTISGTEIRFLLTHEEIGECIGASRETVTRTLADFRQRSLVKLNGSMLTVPSRSALEVCAGIC
jgi:CRP/FNR family transcriptional regulator, cyclic AMP receptor protein